MTIILPVSRRGLIIGGAAGVAGVAAYLALPMRGGSVQAQPTPTLADTILLREAQDIRDDRIGSGISPDGRAKLPLGPHGKRFWLDTQNGNDHAKGNSPDAAFRTEAKAYEHWGAGDQLMIASGSTLTTPAPDLRTLAAFDRRFPTVIQSYDRRRPADESGHGLLANQVAYRGEKPMVGANMKSDGNRNFAIRGITFDHVQTLQHLKYGFHVGIDWLLVEQCAFLAASLTLNALRPCEGHIIRQCAFFGQWDPSERPQGIFTKKVTGTTIEDCVFFHCGWRDGLERSAAKELGGPTIFNHGLYCAVESSGMLRRSVFLSPSSHGAQLRGDWASHDNIFIDCPLALQHGGGRRYAQEAPNGVTAHCYRNIVTVAEDITPSLPRGFGIEVLNTRPGSLVEQCLVVGPGTQVSKPRNAFAASALPGPEYEPNPTIIQFARNTNAWSNRKITQSPGGDTPRVQVTETANLTPESKASFADPTRDGITAAQSLGMASLDALGRAMVADPTQPWAQKIAAHIGPGYAPSPRSVAQLRLADGSFAGAILPDGRWNDGTRA
ncbi:hypothetical protein [Sphingomonas sp.]|uniref:hypothetical protein n=1 Tax=Sphingomonas sp. TaxID=28214 RepID=UPI001B216F0E|nr:hypothetical protein [Sphingomonas sp.]MBO9714533.1 hypothetical protein [Sphingomonas sp.]